MEFLSSLFKRCNHKWVVLYRGRLQECVQCKWCGRTEWRKLMC